MRIEQSSPLTRAARTQIDRPATMRDPSKSPIDVILRNLSETGALLEADEAFPVGTLIGVGIAGAGFHIGRIVRLTPHGMAAEFMLPLDTAAVARAKTAETIVSVAFPQMVTQHTRGTGPAVAQLARRADQPVAGPHELSLTVRSDAEAKATSWIIWAALAAVVIALLAFLLM